MKIGDGDNIVRVLPPMGEGTILKPHTYWVDEGPIDTLKRLKLNVPEGYKYAGLEPGGIHSPAALGLPMHDDEEDLDDEADDDDEGYYDDEDWIDEDEEEEDDDLVDLASTPNRTFPAYMFQVQSNIADSVINAIKAAMEKIKEDDTAWRSPIFFDEPAVPHGDVNPRFQGLMAQIEEDEKKAVTASMAAASAIVAAMKEDEPSDSSVRYPKLHEIWSATDKTDKTTAGREFEITQENRETYSVTYLDNGNFGVWSKSRFATGQAILVRAGIDLSRFPHKCPRCQSAAYQGGGPNDIDCTNKKCQFYRG